MMFCPKCGTVIEEGTTVCINCGLDTAEVNQSPNPVAIPVVTSPEFHDSKADKKTGNSIIKYVYLGLAVVVLIMFFIAASNIASGGNEIMQIQSVGGKTLEEAYYCQLGSIYAGYAMISRSLGIFFASVLVWLGFKK